MIMESYKNSEGHLISSEASKMHHNTADFPSLTISGGIEDPTARAFIIIGINYIQILYCVFTRLNFAPFILLISIH